MIRVTFRPPQIFTFVLIALFSALTLPVSGAVVAPTDHVVNVLESITCTGSGNTLSVVFHATSTIESFQKPEISGSTTIVRLPGMTLGKGALGATCEQLGVDVANQLIRGILVLRITTKHSYGQTTIVRNGPNELVLTCTSGTPSIGNAPTKRGWLLDAIVIDAGHGGVDGGAEGVNGALEKDVTLALAKKLRDKIKKIMPDTKVVMTRETDVFVELYKRTQIANEAGGKLFISLHCNSMPTKPHPAHGCETYILRPGRNADAARVASRENSSVQFESSSKRYGAMDEEQIIVATMAQRSFVRFSELFASKVQKSVAAATPLKNRGVNQAGFYVLVGASMPNILFETAFLSNEKDAAFISSSDGQNTVVDAISQAIIEFAETYQKSLTK